MDPDQHQVKELLASSSEPAPAGMAARSVEEAVAAAWELGLPVMVKARVWIGGRSKAGGVQLAATLDDVRTRTRSILGLSISGHVIRQVSITPAQLFRYQRRSPLTAAILALQPANGGAVVVVTNQMPTVGNEYWNWQLTSRFRA